MKKNLYLPFVFAALTQHVSAQSYYYEQWIDDNRAAAHHGTLVAGEQTLQIDLSGMPYAGLHFLNIIPYDESGEPGIWKQIAFLVPEGWPNTTNGTQMEYWVTGYDKTPKVVPYTSGDVPITIDASNFSPGLHFLNFRTMNAVGERGPWKQIAFLMPEAWPGTTNATTMEYWVSSYDKTPTRKAFTDSQVTLDIDISQMSYGLHFLNIRTQNERGEYGAWKQIPFYISNFIFDPEEMVYEYWLKEDEKKTGKGIFPGTVDLQLDALALTPENHTLHFHACNEFGTYGEIYTITFNLQDIATDISDTSSQQEWLTVRVKERTLVIDSSTDRVLPLYRMDGVLVRPLHISQGQNIINDLQPAIYIIDGMKFRID